MKKLLCGIGIMIAVITAEVLAFNPQPAHAWGCFSRYYSCRPMATPAPTPAHYASPTPRR